MSCDICNYSYFYYLYSYLALFRLLFICLLYNYLKIYHSLFAVIWLFGISLFVFKLFTKKETPIAGVSDSSYERESRKLDFVSCRWLSPPLFGNLSRHHTCKLTCLFGLTKQPNQINIAQNYCFVNTLFFYSFPIKCKIFIKYFLSYFCFYTVGLACCLQ